MMVVPVLLIMEAEMASITLAVRSVVGLSHVKTAAAFLALDTAATALFALDAVPIAVFAFKTAQEAFFAFATAALTKFFVLSAGPGGCGTSSAFGTSVVVIVIVVATETSMAVIAKVRPLVNSVD